ncbi:histidine kinase [Clostridioides difficile]|uniref:histidine kinase n=4 Tax=Clostridioides difficile TaxID=1496 RepID=Q180A9_CLOD6|nr:histidine kinase [Clostridioides difficile]EQE08170.1 his Kinase A domain protein [Clostridioides difficile CD13]EQE46944.1 his Kinase A domain protein [Clostridioides difficile CD42]EQF03836.1 his Kinase A domain protein [Clostridioides difficile CD132]EQF24298.1 his Kinase A domain protein [Clostridioides difficile CD159]EQF33580.1 his Kinase A domain protein [Clostridioides difficile CD165]EQF58355.1 his Kinase A domain protein [Clostridioides difficile CD196]EQG08250.1 his Kinase A do
MVDAMKKYNILKGTLIVLIVSLLAITGLNLLYKYDNKYTYKSIRASNGILTIDNDTFTKGKLVFLIDDWEFYNHKIFKPNDFTEQDIKPEYVFIGQYPDFSMRKGNQSPYGNATYRMRIKNEGKDKLLSLELPEIFSASEVWINGEMVSKLGDVGTEKYRPKIKNSVVSFIAKKNTEIIINVSNFSHYYSGLYYPPALGETKDISNMMFYRLLFYSIICFTTFAIAIFSLSVWFLSNKSKIYLYFGCMCVFFAIHVSYPFVHLLGLPLVSFTYAVEDLSYFMVVLCIICINGSISKIEENKVYRFLILPLGITMSIISIVIPIILLPYDMYFVNIYGKLIDIYKYIVFIYILMSSLVSIYKKTCSEHISSYILVSVNTVFGISILFDAVTSNRFEPIFTGWQTEYCGFVIVILFSVMMINRNRIIIKENEKLTRNLEHEVEVRTNELTTLLNERKRFLADVAHDLKAPVSAIQAFIDLIKVGNIHVDEETRTYLYAINQKSNEVQNRVRSLQEFTSQDKSIGISEKICLNNFIKEIYENNLPDTQACGVNFETYVLEKKIYAKINKEMLTRAFENLIYNALTFTPFDGKIILSMDKEDGFAIIKISDNGKGIPPENIPKVFDRFFTERDNNEPKGQGLGLYIVKSIIREHGGEIFVDSELGKGTVFTIKLSLCFL